MTDILPLIGRSQPLFAEDINACDSTLRDIVASSSFLVLGGAGSIGQAVCKEIFRRQPKKLHVVDISENNLVELVRDIRSSMGYISGDFQTFALDIGSVEFEAFYAADGQYDYVLNLSALKHVRSEKDPFTLMRMIDVNILNTDKTIRLAKQHGSKKYFCVSTDKAANPVNMMGASKRIMELFLQHHSNDICISTARFANVAFSDGSLLHGFNQRLEKLQPIAAPNDIRRYFVTPQESGELCLMSCIFGENGDIFFPKLSEKLHLITFADIACKYLVQRGYQPVLCDNEQQAREQVQQLSAKQQWPCVFSSSDTTGEKDFEEFFTEDETLDMQRFEQLGIIKNTPLLQANILQQFEQRIAQLKQAKQWTKADLVSLFHQMLPQFGHKETGRYLDSKM
ncbi:MAG: UDP-N-acetylglucosamine 4,6-dehydratase [Gammaproteobacteria bacterium]|nr:UDP-N-acetylglucosamine 4,6-dehydratase [Gammaproteobacteria bacterium]